jgi:O-acetylhomoserine (thiol)-lyase
MPIVQSTTYVFDSTEAIGAVFDEPTSALIYSRFANPTVMAVEGKISALEGGVGAMCTSSGQSATLIALLNILNSGDSFVCASQIYGGSINLFTYTFKKLNIECIFVDCDASPDEINAAFKPNTKAIFGETIANPALTVLDIEKFADVAHANKVPLIIDNTLATPILCKPFEFGADIIVHSTSKYMDGHALQVGGVIVDSGNFDWTNGKFPDFTEPDMSYHGLKYPEAYGKAAYIIKARMQLMRDFGAYPSAHSAFLLNLGLETLAIRMKNYCENALKVALFLANSDKVESVKYPGLIEDKYFPMAQKYLSGAGGVITLSLKGGKDAGIRFMDSLKLASKEVHVADIRTSVLHPASSTHRQLPVEKLPAAGVDPGMVRLSVGLEHPEDIIADLEAALDAV